MQKGIKMLLMWKEKKGGENQAMEDYKGEKNFYVPFIIAANLLV